MAVIPVIAAVAAITAAAGLTGCSSAPIDGADRQLQEALRSRGVEPASVLVPWRINDEMRQWVHQQVPDNLAAEDRLTRLLQALLGSDGLGLQYEAGLTTTGEEAFARRKANCMGFTGLFVGLARELGVPAFYLEIGDIEKFEREGSLVIEAGHVTAGFGEGDLLRILEFTPASDNVNYRLRRRVADTTAMALFYSNRCAELLQAGRNLDALEWARQATRLDPDLARAWVNLGVAQRRSGNAAAAESSYHRALEVDPTAVAAYQNLAALLYSLNRSGEAAELMALSARLDSRNPFNFLALGDVALANGRIEEARRFYRKATRLSGASTEAMAALGQAALAAGDRRDAKRWLRKAAERDPLNDRVVSLAARLHEPIGVATAAAGRNAANPPQAGPPPPRPALLAPGAPATPGTPGTPGIVLGGLSRPSWQTSRSPAPPRR